MAEHTPTPWLYRPHRHDDWGWIRIAPEPGDTVGPLVACARSGTFHTGAELDEHRSNKTDPYGANAAFIVKAVNSHDALVKALERILKYGELGCVDVGSRYTGGKKPATKDVWQFPRHMLTDIEEAISIAKGGVVSSNDREGSADV